MTKYGYVSGCLKDEVSKQDDFEHQAKILLSMGIPYDHCFADVFRGKTKIVINSVNSLIPLLKKEMS